MSRQNYPYLPPTPTPPIPTFLSTRTTSSNATSSSQRCQNCARVLNPLSNSLIVHESSQRIFCNSDCKWSYELRDYMDDFCADAVEENDVGEEELIRIVKEGFGKQWGGHVRSWEDLEEEMEEDEDGSVSWNGKKDNEYGNGRERVGGKIDVGGSAEGRRKRSEIWLEKGNEEMDRKGNKEREGDAPNGNFEKIGGMTIEWM